MKFLILQLLQFETLFFLYNLEQSVFKKTLNTLKNFDFDSFFLKILEILKLNFF